MIAEKVQVLFDRFTALSLREKGLIVLTSVVVIVFGAQLIVVEPLLAENTKVAKQVIQAQKQFGSLKNKLANSQSNLIEIETGMVRKEMLVVQQQLDNAEVELSEFASAMVSAEEMPQLLQFMLADHSLRLVSMRNQTPEPILILVESDVLEDAAGPKPTGLYRHGLALELTGSYPDVLRYIEKLENQSSKLIWHSMKYEVEQYPIGSVSLVFQTISTEKGWLGV